MARRRGEDIQGEVIAARREGRGKQPAGVRNHGFAGAVAPRGGGAEDTNRPEVSQWPFSWRAGKFVPAPASASAASKEFPSVRQLNPPVSGGVSFSVFIIFVPSKPAGRWWSVPLASLCFACFALAAAPAARA